MRFGLAEAHAIAAAIALGYLHDQGGITYDAATNRWAVNFEKFREGIRSLDAELLTLEGNGDAAGVQKFFDQRAKIIPEVQKSLDTVKDLPIDAALYDTMELI